jgi:hypothetical protein
MQSGDKFYPAASKEALLDGLPPGNFIIEASMSGLYFKRVDSFQPNGKVYGNLNVWTERILQTFEDRTVSTGLLLAGEKGSGKSLLGRLISLKANEQKIPTVIINAAFDGSNLESLLGELNQPVVVFFDEFDKIYNDNEKQQSILSLLDGTASHKHLFIITCNETWRLSNYLLNRPGRIFYFIEFNGIKEDFIREYCEDNLNNKSEIDNIINISNIFEKFNFDMLKSLVEEINRYNEPALKAIELLNILPMKERNTYQLSVTDKEGQDCNSSSSEFVGSPLEENKFHILIQIVDKDGDDDWEEILFLNSNLKKFDPVSKSFIYVNAQGYCLTLKIVQKQSVNWLDAM